MYDEYRTLPSAQAAVSPWQRKRQETLLQALVEDSPRATHGPASPSESSRLHDLLNRSAEWQSRRSARLHAAREAQRTEEDATLDFHPRILRRPSPYNASGEQDGPRRQRCPASFYAAQREWQQRVEQKLETLRRQESKEAAEDIAQGVQAVRQLVETNRSHVPVRAIPEPAPEPRADPPPRPSPLVQPSRGAFTLATAARAQRRRVQPAEDTVARVPKRRTPSRVRLSTTATTATTDEQTAKHTPPVEVAVRKPSPRLTRSEEMQLVAHLFAPAPCHHASHNCHSPSKDAESPSQPESKKKKKGTDHRTFLARQALSALKARIKFDETRAEIAEARASAWQRDVTFAPVISPRSRVLAAQFESRLVDGAAAAPEQHEAEDEVSVVPSTALQQLADEDDSHAPERSGVMMVVRASPERTGVPWTSKEATQAAAQLAFCDARLDRVRRARVTDPVRRVLRYTDIRQLRLAVPESPQTPQRDAKASGSAAERDGLSVVAGTREADANESRQALASVMSSHVSPVDASHEDARSPDGVPTTPSVKARAGPTLLAEEHIADEAVPPQCEPWPTPPQLPLRRQRVPLSLARDEDASGLASRTVNSPPRTPSAADTETAPQPPPPPPRLSRSALDMSATYWVTDPAPHQLLTPDWAASVRWSECASDAVIHPAHTDQRDPQRQQPQQQQHQADVGADPVTTQWAAAASPSPSSSSSQETHMLRDWWHRLGASSTPRLPLEKVLNALQMLLDLVGAHGRSRPRLGFEPLFLDIPLDQDGSARRFSVYLVMPLVQQPRAVRIAYREPLSGTVDDVDFHNLYHWLIEAGALVNERMFVI